MIGATDLLSILGARLLMNMKEEGEREAFAASGPSGLEMPAEMEFAIVQNCTASERTTESDP